jgi:hypothetical protein
MTDDPQIVTLRCIDHCMGFGKIDNKYYIVDKENTFDYSNWENIE